MFTGKDHIRGNGTNFVNDSIASVIVLDITQCNRQDVRFEIDGIVFGSLKCKYHGNWGNCHGRRTANDRGRFVFGFLILREPFVRAARTILSARSTSESRLMIFSHFYACLSPISSSHFFQHSTTVLILIKLKTPYFSATFIPNYDAFVLIDEIALKSREQRVEKRRNKTFFWKAGRRETKRIKRYRLSEAVRKQAAKARPRYFRRAQRP